MKNSKYSRRDFINLTAGSIAAGLITTSCTQDASDAVDTVENAVADIVTPNVPIGVQLYCFRHLLEEDTPGSLAKIAEIGYEHVETAGYYGLTAPELRKMFDDNGLKCFSAHVGMGDLSPETLKATADYHAVLGNERLVIPGIPQEDHESQEALMACIDRMNVIAETLRARGMKTGYHCHAYTFEKVFDGKTIWQHITDNTNDDFIMQLDVGNAAHGKADIPQVVRDTPGRILSIHAKPYSSSSDDPFNSFIGDDELDWPAILDLLENGGGVDQYIIEYEHEGHPPLDALAANLAAFKSMGR